MAVGFPGVTMWRDCPWENEYKGFQWETIRMKDRIVLICFDSDSTEKPDVRNQIVSLYLFCKKKKSKVKIITWPKEEGKGIDDYLVQKRKKEQSRK